MKPLALNGLPFDYNFAGPNLAQTKNGQEEKDDLALQCITLRNSNEHVLGDGADTNGFGENGDSPEGGEQPVVLRNKAQERFFEKAIGKICSARGRSSGNGPGRKGRVGIAHLGREDGRNALPAKRGPLFRAGLEYEALHHRAGTHEARS